MRKRTIAALAALLLGATLPAAPRHTVLLQEAAVAAKAGAHATVLVKLREAERLRPDYPRIQVNLARTYTALGQIDEAIAALQRLVDMNIPVDVTDDPAFASLAELPDFQAVHESSAKLHSVVPTSNEVAFELTEVTGIIESCLIDPETKQAFFGDVRHRCVWMRDGTPITGALKKFTHDEDALDGVFKIALSADRKTLWAATAAVGVMSGPDAEDGKRSALVAIDFSTGRVRARHPVPADGRKHLLGDFVIAPDGTLYATDSLAPIIWRLRPGGRTLEPWLQSDEFLSLQGIAFSEDGNQLYVADYANGIWRIDPVARSAALLIAPPNATFFGIDGLYAVPGGLLAVQNGVSPQRVLCINFPHGEPPSARIVATGHPAMTDLALGQVASGRFHFVGNSGWSLFDPPPTEPPAPRAVTIYSTPLDSL